MLVQRPPVGCHVQLRNSFQIVSLFSCWLDIMGLMEGVVGVMILQIVEKVDALLMVSDAGKLLSNYALNSSS